AALSSQKAVYLITDTNTGKLYVGSATSNNGMLLKRWKDYLETGHGGNEELIKLVEAKGIKYIEDHFQYSILENYNANV
ncbi:GIY-YIG nuclease family protein, partial [Klebsiella pneumoniae]|uniref:GIY-YIG nuclease family protein n=1 Tax=Klebsiella pneumoniae TaxID=573 RepID=UPI00255709C8